MMNLTEEELRLLKELKAAREASRGLKRLVRAGYATAHGAGIDCTVYLITWRGEEALATA
jgi:hypothetical protein